MYQKMWKNNWTMQIFDDIIAHALSQALWQDSSDSRARTWYNFSSGPEFKFWLGWVFI